jgi:hypothetical protein
MSYFLSFGKWILNVVDMTHNLKMAKRFEGHGYVERLKVEETVLVREMANNLVLPRNKYSVHKKKK